MNRRPAEPKPKRAARPATRRYAAFLRGVSPMNCKMPALKACFEAAGFRDVRTLLSSGNVVFSAPRASGRTLERTCESAIEKGLGRTFPVIVRAVDQLDRLLASDPFAKVRLAKGAKRVVTFLKTAPKAKLRLPLEVHGARILRLQGNEVFTVYVQSPRGAVFMTLIEKTFGKDVTTRTWETVTKVAKG
ncbi:MAG TPA: DUF1697 domain-containing protein [Polyangiaceae bacterium]